MTIGTQTVNTEWNAGVPGLPTTFPVFGRIDSGCRPAGTCVSLAWVAAGHGRCASQGRVLYQEDRDVRGTGIMYHQTLRDRSGQEYPHGQGISATDLDQPDRQLDLFEVRIVSNSWMSGLAPVGDQGRTKTQVIRRVRVD